MEMVMIYGMKHGRVIDRYHWHNEHMWGEISTTGSHPCAYIIFAKDSPVAKYFRKYQDSRYLYDLIPMNVHGGVTFAEYTEYATLKVGWDYAHLGDYTVYVDDDGTVLAEHEGHKWTIKELRMELFDALQQACDLQHHIRGC